MIKKNLKKNTIKIIFLLIIIILSISFFVYPKNSQKTNYYSITEQQKRVSSFANLGIEAKSAIVFDYLENRPIFELNSQTQLPIASLTKIMTIVLAKEILPSSEFVSLSKDIKKALFNSSNQSALTISTVSQKFLGPNNFITEMNKKAQEIGMNQTYFLNETGLDINKNIAGAYGSAQDIIKLMGYALKNNFDIFEINNNEFDYNTNPYATSTTLLLFSKTGLTNLSGGNLAIVFEAGLGHPIGIVVLGSSEKGRFSDSEKLIEATFEYFKEI